MKFMLTEEEHEQLTLLAGMRGESAAVVLRGMIRDGFAAAATKAASKIYGPLGIKVPPPSKRKR